jgi:hypothetical protein
LHVDPGQPCWVTVHVILEQGGLAAAGIAIASKVAAVPSDTVTKPLRTMGCKRFFIFSPLSIGLVLHFDFVSQTHQLGNSIALNQGQHS